MASTQSASGGTPAVSRRVAWPVLAAFAVMLGLSGAAQAQQYQPGLLDAIGRWFKDTSAGLNSSLKDTKDNLDSLGKEAGGAAKDTVDSMKRLPSTRVVTGRERCVMASNGAPDCRLAAEAVCRANGLPTGKSLDIQSAEDCPPQVWALGRPAQPGDCKTNTYVTRALCQ